MVVEPFGLSVSSWMSFGGLWFWRNRPFSSVAELTSVKLSVVPVVTSLGSFLLWVIHVCSLYLCHARDLSVLVLS